MNLFRFGYDTPLRPSSLDGLMACSAREVLKMIDPYDDSGVAAETGSLAHAAIAEFHRATDDRIAAALAGIDANAAAFPRADIAAARVITRHYVNDPRNQIADLRAVEQTLAIEILPHPSDDTGLPIRITGTLDQLRVEDGHLVVWDVKTGNMDEKIRPESYVRQYVFQLSAYTVAADMHFGHEMPVRPGGYIYTTAYRKRGASLPSPENVFVDAGFTLDDAKDFIYTELPRRVAEIRRGTIAVLPSAACGYCNYGCPKNCMAKIRQTDFDRYYPLEQE